MHIGLIPDGNRRWAKERGLRKHEGHERGAAKIRDFLQWSKEKGIDEVSVFVLSSENVKKRSKREIIFLKRLLIKEMEKYKDLSNLYEIQFVGEYSILGKKVKDAMEGIMKKSRAQKGRERMKVNFLVGYGGRWEIEQAFKNKDKINNIKDALIIKSDIDLIIRTGKERRLSNFLLYQSAYAEIYFLDKYWPSFTKEDFNTILEWFNGRNRRFGK